MAQVLTVVAAFVAGALVLWFVVRPRLATDTVQVSLRLDRASPGAHLIWNIGNVGTAPITVTDLIIHGRHGATETMGLERPSALEPADHVLVPTDVNWTLLGARSIAVADADGREHLVSRRQLVRIQEQLRSLIERRTDVGSARDFLFGAADLAFGAVILGLGFFLLMWVIATG